MTFHVATAWMVNYRVHADVFPARLLLLLPPCLAADPDLLQDICVADLSSNDVKLNGFACKPAASDASQRQTSSSGAWRCPAPPPRATS
ncbi:hypothetical protein OPV22_013767 [Ensete ventricosum]|uniref:Secreted protein n=1 Tax=Ensete ventricosum TaxID=4639 RepID=A0AAV8RAE7_ENSVE|nr:hypothetical protein OPV22_013767 [Ensete ventricosum]